MKKIYIVIGIILCVLFCILTIKGCETANKTSNDSDDNESKDEPKSYYVDNTYFSEATFEKNVTLSFAGGGGSTQYNYQFDITSSCAVALYEYSANVKVYSADYTLLHAEDIRKEKEIPANSDFKFSVYVTKDIQSRAAYVKVSLSGRTYTNLYSSDTPTVTTPQITKKYTVTFVYNNGTQNKSESVISGKTLETPSDPTKANYTFKGWFTDKALKSKYDFSKAVTKDLTLYAKYELDAVTITNTISKDTIRSIVKVYNKCYNTFLGIPTSSVGGQGSGFCFQIQNGYYYILTNCHVAVKNPDFEKQEFVIEDYQGNTYTGYLYENPSTNISAISASYDLACLYFKATSSNVKKLPILNTNPTINDDVISLGAPKSQSNAITYGQVNSYSKVTLSCEAYESNVKFDVIRHDAFIDHGSSGGPLLNSDLKVVGVNFAGATDGSSCAAIPAKKVIEFLQKYIYN